MDERIGNLVSLSERAYNEQREDREESRKNQESLRAVIGSLSQSVTTLSDNVREMKPIVTNLEAGRNRTVGIVWALRMAWLGAGGLIGFAATKMGAR